MRIAVAWAAWDRWCVAAAESRYGGGPRAGHQVSGQLTESVCAGAHRLGVSHMELWRRLVAKRGLGYEQAVASVVEELESERLTRSTRQSENPCSEAARTAHNSGVTLG